MWQPASITLLNKESSHSIHRILQSADIMSLMNDLLSSGWVTVHCSRVNVDTFLAGYMMYFISFNMVLSVWGIVFNISHLKETDKYGIRQQRATVLMRSNPIIIHSICVDVKQGIQLSFCELNSAESIEFIEFVEKLFLIVLKIKNDKKIVFYKF